MTQPSLPDPLLEEMEALDLASGLCRGVTVKGRRCKLVAPKTERGRPWLCRHHR